MYQITAYWQFPAFVARVFSITSFLSVGCRNSSPPPPTNILEHYEITLGCTESREHNLLHLHPHGGPAVPGRRCDEASFLHLLGVQDHRPSRCRTSPEGTMKVVVTKAELNRMVIADLERRGFKGPIQPPQPDHPRQ